MELQTFRQQCGDLEQKVSNFMQEKEQFEKEVKCNFTLLYTTEPVQFVWSGEQQSPMIAR